MSERVETVVIGSGQAGLAVGYHLAKRGRPFVILDASERVGDSWRNRWDSLRLFTPARYDGLPGSPFPAEPWVYPTKNQVADYLEAYAARFDLPVRNGVAVDRLSREGDRYVVATGDDRLVADNVVVASGTYHRLRVPDFAQDLDPGIMQLGSTEYRGPSQLREGDVLVVGAGTLGPRSPTRWPPHTEHGCRARRPVTSPFVRKASGTECSHPRSGSSPRVC